MTPWERVLHPLDRLRERAAGGDETAADELLTTAADVVATRDDVYLGEIAQHTGITHRRLRAAVLAHPRTAAQLAHAQADADARRRRTDR